MISIHTHSTKIYHLERWRYLISRRLLNKQRGPDAVRDSLIRGLQDLKIDFKLNPKQPSEVAIVLSGVCALKQLIKCKESGITKSLIAGPNMVAHPREANGIMLSKEIDVVLVPSKWVADLYAEVVPELTSKVKVWPSGVSISGSSTRRGSPIIYDKLGDKELVSKIQQILGVSTTVFSYGSFNQRNYLNALSKAPYLVYLAKSESQGLALQEAWAHDVPTLVNKSTHWEADVLSWDAPQINCPYLTPELGTVFENIEELPIMIEHTSSLHPKHYCDEHLSDRASVQKLLSFI